jgi:hypothetical protein
MPKRHRRREHPATEPEPQVIKDESKYNGILFLIVVSILIKLIVIAFSEQAAFVDAFDTSYYHDKYVTKILAGQIPYVDFSVDYPQLFLVPVLIAKLLSPFFGNYYLAYMVLAAAVDCVVIVLVYLVGRKILDDAKAYGAAFLYATALGPAYFVLTKYDVFPTALMMLSLFLMLKGDEFKSYLTTVAGYLMKFYPLVLIPFYWIYNMKNGKTTNKSLFKALMIGFIILGIFAIRSFETFIYTYTINFGWTHPMSHGFVYYVNHLTGSDAFTGISSLFIGAILIVLIAWYYRSDRKDMKALIGLSALSVFVMMFFNNVSSPQYCVWVAPFFAIFLIDNIYEILLFYAFAAITYIDFPLAYGHYYDNVTGYFGTGAVIIFTIKFVILGIIAYIIARKTMVKSTV